MSTEGLWHVRFTFVDHAANEFIELGAATISDGHEAPVRQAWSALPEEPDGDFLADLWGEDCHVDDRPVTVAAIEEITGRTIADLLAEGREENRLLCEQIAYRLRAPALQEE